MRWTAYAATLLLVALVAAVGLTVPAFRRSMPQTSGSVEVPGLGYDVEVLRDAHGIPQVYADAAEDLFFAQGYVQAQHRFFEMDVRRHITPVGSRRCSAGAR